MEYINELEKSLTDEIRLKVDLNYNSVMKAETNLGALLADLFKFHNHLIARRQDINISEVFSLN